VRRGPGGRLCHRVRAQRGEQTAPACRRDPSAHAPPWSCPDPPRSTSLFDGQDGGKVWAASAGRKTAVPAPFLGGHDRIGTLEAGGIADVIAVRGDPLADLAALGRVTFVAQDGRVVRQDLGPSSAGAASK